MHYKYVILVVLLILTVAVQPATNGPVQYVIAGIGSCGFYKMARDLGRRLEKAYPGDVRIILDETDWGGWENKKRELYPLVPKSDGHRTSPFIYIVGQPNKFVGGFDRFSELVSREYPKLGEHQEP